MPSSYFTYRALTPEQSSIRLLQVLPGNTAADEVAQTPKIESRSLSCSVFHTTLENAPAYTALSYTWGDAAPTCTIQLDGSAFMVAENLLIALRHLMASDRPVTVWVDALCIDQHNEVEKTEQVQQMQHIYAHAAYVTAWLGPEADNSDLAMQWIEHYGGLAKQLGIGSTPELRLLHLCHTIEMGTHELTKDVRDFTEQVIEQLSSSSGKYQATIQALASLLKRPIWCRVWIVQEIVHGKSVQFRCGDIIVTEDALHFALRLLRNFRQFRDVDTTGGLISRTQEHAISQLDTRNPINILKLRRSSTNFDLIYLIRHLHRFRATDPRDMVFALFNIAMDITALQLQPDYSKACAQVFMETARALLENGHFDTLCLCHTSTAVKGLPSWVPDFTCTDGRDRIQQRAADRASGSGTTVLQPRFSASGHVNSLFRPEEISGKTLKLRAILIGKVDRLGAAWQHDRYAAWFQDLLECSRTQKGLPDESSLHAVCRAAVADQEVRIGNQKPRMSRELADAVVTTMQQAGGFENVHTLAHSSHRIRQYLYQLRSVAAGRRPFGAQGCFGIGPSEMLIDDLVYCFVGADVPFVLRRGSQDELFLIGEVYLHGGMDGELIDDHHQVASVDIC